MKHELLQKAKEIDNEYFDAWSYFDLFNSGALISLVKNSWIFSNSKENNEENQAKRMKMFSLIENDLQECEKKIANIFFEIREQKQKEFEAL